jgi:two-component system alkaline phosphatase synthesis response regulator PhoP
MSELVLVVEDEKEIQDLIRYNLERAGFRVVTEGDGERGLERVFSAKPDALVLDLMLPGASGLEILREVRGEPVTGDLPVIVLTARSAEMDKLVGFEHGADDYLTKPFSPKELVARLRAILRRSKPGLAVDVIEVGDLRIDHGAREVSHRGEKLSMTRREFELLAYLAHNAGRVYSREELLRKVWGYDFVGETRTVDVHIRRLRKKLGEENHLIETVTGSGYKFLSPSTTSNL